MRKEWSRRNYVWGKTDIVPSISSSCSSFDREYSIRECDEDIEHTLGVKNASKWCSYSVRETHTLFSNEKYRNIWKFVILKIKFTDKVFNDTKIKLNLFERTSEHQLFSLSTLFDLQRVSLSPQHYSSAIPDNTPGFIWDKRRCLRDRPIKNCFCQSNKWVPIWVFKGPKITFVVVQLCLFIKWLFNWVKKKSFKLFSIGIL